MSLNIHSLRIMLINYPKRIGNLKYIQKIYISLFPSQTVTSEQSITVNLVYGLKLTYFLWWEIL